MKKNLTKNNKTNQNILKNKKNPDQSKAINSDQKVKIENKPKNLSDLKLINQQYPNNTEDIHKIFVYGSLRPDDDSGQSWTKEACEGMKAEPAHIQGCKLFFDSQACAVPGFTTFPNSHVKGQVLSSPGGRDQMWFDKVKEYDRIEGQRGEELGEDEMPNLYNRICVNALVQDNTNDWNSNNYEKGVVIKVQMYVRPDCNKDIEVPGGDWMARDRENDTKGCKNN